MKTYPIVEIFYSLQGEGIFTGTPAVFIRFAGCNLGCSFCDTNVKKTVDLSKEEILTKIRDLTKLCKLIILTGGEPNIHDLVELCDYLHKFNYHLHLETNGEPTEYLKSNLPELDFITLSPKTLQVSPIALDYCDEVKLLVGPKGWENFIQTIDNILLPSIKRWVMPVADGLKIIPSNTALAVKFCKHHPNFSLCLQTHKLISIP